MVETFPCYDDQGTFAGESVFLRKRAQILVAETWAAFEGVGYGYFHDIDQLTVRRFRFNICIVLLIVVF